MNKRRRLAIVLPVVITVAVAALWYTKPWLPAFDTGLVFASGTVDATQVSISFRVPGILRQRLVDEGSIVKRGDVLAALDTREASARLRQAEAAEESAQAHLRDLEQGYRPEEIAEARAQVDLARVNLTNLQDEARRSENLYTTGAVSRQRRDKDATTASVAREQLAAATARLNLMEAGFRQETIASAQAQVTQAQAAVEVAQVILEDLWVTSMIDGTVTRKHAEPGETLAAGRPVVTVTDLSSPWVRVYIPENQIGRVRLNASAQIKVDTFPDHEYAGRVSYVSAEAEFTPKNVQTQEERVKLVFAVDVVVSDADGTLKPGMPADVYIDAGLLQPLAPGLKAKP